MARFLIVWSVFSVRKWSAQLSWRYRPLTGYGQKAVRRVMRFTPMPLLLLAVRALCRLRLLGRQYRGRSAVATQNYRCLTGVEGRIDAGWIAMRRQLLETGATWGQHPAILAQMQACTRELDAGRPCAAALRFRYLSGDGRGWRDAGQSQRSGLFQRGKLHRRQPKNGRRRALLLLNPPG